MQSPASLATFSSLSSATMLMQYRTFWSLRLSPAPIRVIRLLTARAALSTFSSFSPVIFSSESLMTTATPYSCSISRILPSMLPNSSAACSILSRFILTSNSCNYLSRFLHLKSGSI